MSSVKKKNIYIYIYIYAQLKKKIKNMVKNKGS